MQTLINILGWIMLVQLLFIAIGLLAASLLAKRKRIEEQNTPKRDPAGLLGREVRALNTLDPLQRQIEARRAAGQRVPAAWVTDSFHRAYYQKQGWLEEEAKP